MEPVVISCGGCGTAVRIRHPEIAGRRVCPRCKAVLAAPIGPALATAGSPPFDDKFHHPIPGDASSPDGMAEVPSLPLPGLSTICGNRGVGRDRGELVLHERLRTRRGTGGEPGCLQQLIHPVGQAPRAVPRVLKADR